MNYPGAFILNEYGTNKELAKTYGVSERTIYRWKNKAKAETGSKIRKTTRPRVSTLENFKGTRKQLAKRYGVSERTAYRWLKQAKERGAEIPSRQKKSEYPGSGILNENLKNKDLALKYNVSERTISRWKRRARTEIEEPFEVLPPEPENIEEPFEVLPPETEDFFEENFGQDFGEEFRDQYQYKWDDDEFIESLKAIDYFLTAGDEPILSDNSLYKKLNDAEKLQYIDAYLNYQYRQDEHQFYDPATHSIMYDPDDPTVTNPGFIANLDIWGDDFEDWLAWQDEARTIEL